MHLYVCIFVLSHAFAIFTFVYSPAKKYTSKKRKCIKFDIKREGTGKGGGTLIKNFGVVVK